MSQLFIIAGLLLVVSVEISYAGYGHHHGYGHHSVTAAVQSHHNVKYYNVHGYHHRKPIHIDVPGHSTPIYMTFHSKSSKLIPNQHHEGQGGSYHESHSQDKPHILKHTVIKPVKQEIKEIITPYRKIIQEIKPVKEEVETLVAKHGGYDHHHHHHGYEKHGYEKHDEHGGGYGHEEYKHDDDHYEHDDQHYY